MNISNNYQDQDQEKEVKNLILLQDLFRNHKNHLKKKKFKKMIIIKNH